MIAAQQFGIGMTEVCGWVGQVLGMLYAIGYNVFASLWNVIAAFAEFFANVWNDPLGATARLFFDIFDTILGIVETTAGAIDALLGTSLAGTVAGFRGKLSGRVDDTFGAVSYTHLILTPPACGWNSPSFWEGLFPDERVW